MGTVSTVDISGKGQLRIQNHPWKLEKRGLQTLTMALALAHTMALGMAWDVFMAGMEASMDMASGDALWRRVSQRQGKAKQRDPRSLFTDTTATMTTTTTTITLIMDTAMVGETQAKRPFKE